MLCDCMTVDTSQHLSTKTFQEKKFRPDTGASSEDVDATKRICIIIVYDLIFVLYLRAACTYRTPLRHP